MLSDCLMFLCSYNSVFYPSLSANDYFIFAVNQAFIDSPTFNTSSLPTDELGYWSFLASDLNQEAYSGRLQRLEKADCIEAYASDYLHDRSNLFLVSPAEPSVNATPTILDTFYFRGENLDTQRNCDPDPYPWICPPVNEGCPLTCKYRLQQVLDDIGSWAPLGFPVNYCLSQKTPEIAG